MKNSLKKEKEYKNVYENGVAFASKNMVLYVLKNGATERNRYGISVSHKVGNSVVRHALIRKTREINRKNDEKIKQGYDIVTILRVQSNTAKYENLNEEFLYLCKRHDILAKED